MSVCSPRYRSERMAWALSATSTAAADLKVAHCADSGLHLRHPHYPSRQHGQCRSVHVNDHRDVASASLATTTAPTKTSWWPPAAKRPISLHQCHRHNTRHHRRRGRGQVSDDRGGRPGPDQLLPRHRRRPQGGALREHGLYHRHPHHPRQRGQCWPVHGGDDRSGWPGPLSATSTTATTTSRWRTAKNTACTSSHPHHPRQHPVSGLRMGKQITR